jgi:thiol:disulfide interchange protein
MVEILLRLSILLLVIVLLALLANRVFGADQPAAGVPDCGDTAATKPQATKPIEAPVTANDPQPLVLLVTAKWCPVCHDVEGVLSKMRAAGELDGFYTMKVDYDENRKLAEAVMQGSGSTGIPQLVIYRPIKRLIGRVDRTQIGKQLSGVAKASGTAVLVTPSTVVPIPTTAPASVFSSPRHPILDAAGFGLQRGRNGVWYSCIDVKD